MQIADQDERDLTFELWCGVTGQIFSCHFLR